MVTTEPVDHQPCTGQYIEPALAKRSAPTNAWDVLEPMTPLEESCFLGHHGMQHGTQADYVKYVKRFLTDHPVIKLGSAFAGCDVFTKVLAALQRYWSKTFGMTCEVKLEWHSHNSGIDRFTEISVSQI